MKKGVILFFVVAGTLAVAYFAWAPKSVQAVKLDPCTPAKIAETATPFNSILRAFDDTSLLAFNLPRNEVVTPIMHLQELHRNLQDLEAPLCAATLKAQMLTYTEGILDALIKFMSGASPAEARAGLESVLPLRSTIGIAIAQMLGITPAPNPMAFQNEIIPVTGNSQQSVGSPEAPSPTPKAMLYATVSNSKGVNVRFGPGVSYSFQYTVSFGSQVELIGASEDQQWVFVRVPGAEEISGWIFAPLLTFETSIDSLPIAQP